MNKLCKAILLPSIGLTFGVLEVIQLMVTQFYTLAFIISSICAVASLFYLIWMYREYKE